MSPSSNRWLVDERNSITRNSTSVQSEGNCGSRFASGHCVVETSFAKRAFCGAALALTTRTAHASKPNNHWSSLIPPPPETAVVYAKHICGLQERSYAQRDRFPIERRLVRNKLSVTHRRPGITAHVLVSASWRAGKIFFAVGVSL